MATVSFIREPGAPSAIRVARGLGEVTVDINVHGLHIEVTRDEAATLAADLLDTIEPMTAVAGDFVPLHAPLGAIAIRQDWLYKGMAKLDASGVQLPADATDHAIVYDPITGLMEAIRPKGFDKSFTHNGAVKATKSLQHAGYNDWQVPSIPEASHSIDYDFDSPAADPSLYPDAVAAGYWTRQQTNWTKRNAGSARSFFYVSMYGGAVGSSSAGLRLRVRPVRRGVPASQCLSLCPAVASDVAGATA